MGVRTHNGNGYEQNDNVDCSENDFNNVHNNAQDNIQNNIDFNLTNQNMDTVVDEIISQSDVKIKPIKKKEKYKYLGMDQLSKLLTVNSKNGMSIAQINVRSIIPKIEEIRYILAKTELDILCINETWLDSSVHDFEIMVNDYNVIRKDRNRNGGGVCLYIKEQLEHKHRPDLELETVECQWVEIPNKHSRPLLLCNVYRPPDANADYYNDIVNMINVALLEDKYTIITGDLNFNYKIDESLCNNPVKYIEDVFMLTQLVDQYTRVTTDNKSLIDVILSSDKELHLKTGVHCLTLSDHYLCYTVLDFDCIKGKHKTVSYRDYKNFNKQKFILDMNSCKAMNVESINDLDDAWVRWRDSFNNICKDHAPVKKCRVKNRYKPWVTTDHVKLMYQRDHLHKQAVLTGDANIWSQYRKLRNKITKTIKQAKSNFYHTLLIDNKSNPKRFWKELSKIMPSKINTKSIPSNMTADDFNTYFANVGNNTVKDIQRSTDEEPLWKGPKSIYEFHLSNVSVDDVLKSLLAMPDTSSNDILGMDAKLLKMAANIIAPQLTYMFNLSIKLSKVIDEWKIARVTPIYKGKGDVLDPGNFRPISVVCHIGKLLERQVYRQLIIYCKEHNFISSDQSAYLENHSTQTSLHRVVDDWLEAMNEGQLVGACFLDISKCFDTIDHKFLLKKLDYYGIRNAELNWFQSYLTNRGQKVKCNGITSDSAGLEIGVPQGSVLGPFLFLIYANDLGNFIGSGTCNCFADDTVIYVVGETVEQVTKLLQKMVHGVRGWYEGNMLKINASKSEILLIGTKQKLRGVDANTFVIDFNGTVMNKADIVKYLGIMVDQHLDWSNEVSHLCRTVGLKLHHLRRLSSFMSTELLSKIYCTYIQPVLEYACTVWGYSSERNIHRICRLQKLAARIVSKNYDFVNVRGDDLIQELKWPSFIARRDLMLMSLIYKSVHGKAPSYLINHLNFVYEISSKTTRGSSDLNLLAPKPNIEQFKESFQYMGPWLWNQLPINIRSAESLPSFKKMYKDHYF
jgi:exonuclease III